LARAFLQLARHRLPGSTFDSLLQEALAACDPAERALEGTGDEAEMVRGLQGDSSETECSEVETALPVVISADL
jgi:hypothetical protein